MAIAMMMNNTIEMICEGAKVPATACWMGSMKSVVPAVEMMPRKMMREIPLPTPYSVMRSPSHMVSMAPAEYRMIM